MSLIFLALAYLLGIVLGTYILIPAHLLPAAPLLILAVTLLCGLYRSRPVIKTALLLLLCFSGAVLMTSLTFHSYLAPHSLFNWSGREVQLLGRVNSFPQAVEGGFRYTLRPELILKEGEEIKISTGLLQVETGGAAPGYGDLMMVSGLIENPAGLKNPGGYSYRHYLYRRGIAGRLNHEGSLKLVEEGRGLLNLLSSLREGIRDRIKTYFDAPYSSLLLAFLLGEQGGLEGEIRQLFQETGLGHLLAVSGLHVGIISLFFWQLTGRLGLSSVLCSVLNMLLIAVFILISGAQPPVLRAGLLAIIYHLSLLFSFRLKPLDTAGLAALILLIYNPFYLYEIGFQLSFAVYISLILLTPPIEGLWQDSIPPLLGKPLALSLAAQLGAWPLLIYYFQQVSLLPLLVNLLAIPLLSLIMILALVTLFLSLFSSLLTGIVSLPLTLLIWIKLNWLKMLEGLELFKLRMGIDNLFIPLLYFIFLLLLCYFCWKKKGSLGSRHPALLVMITLLILFSMAQLLRAQKEGLRIIFLDVGPGLAVYLSLPTGENIFYDGGGIVDFSDPGGLNNIIAESVIEPFLFAKGLTSLEGIIFSHYHADHVLGLLPLVAGGRTGFISGPRREEGNYLYQELQKISEVRELPFFYLQEGDRFQLGEVLFKVLAPFSKELSGTNSDENNNSVVIRLSYGDFSLLLTGDIEEEMEECLVSRPKLRNELSAMLLQVPHHGSITSSTPEFLDAVGPGVAVVSAGLSSFNHPSPAVVERMKSRGIRVYRTDTMGAVVVEVESGGESFSVYSWGYDHSNFRLLIQGGSS